MKCPCCGGAELVQETRDIVHKYKDHTLTIKAVTADYCPACNEAVTGPEETERTMKEISEFVKAVNSQSLQPQLIAQVRKRLKITQKEAADIFGGGINAFSRYETGKVAPPLSLMLLLSVLNKKPELLEDVKQTSSKLSAFSGN